MRKIFLFFLFLLVLPQAFANPKFVPNQGQWDGDFQYKLDFRSGSLFFSKDRITTTILDMEDLRKAHDSKCLSHKGHGAHEPEKTTVKGYNYHINLLGAQTKAIRGKEKLSMYHNYFLGSDSSRWKSRVPVFSILEYQDVYPGVNMSYYEEKGQLKYEFHVAAGADAGRIMLEYEGAPIALTADGNLQIDIDFEKVIEMAPYCYQVIDGKKIEVPSLYQVNGQVVSFAFPKGYSKAHPLIIDPAVLFKSYSGSTSEVTTYSHCYDSQGRLCILGETVGNGFRSTTGVFQTTFQGPTTTLGGDACILVFSPNGNMVEFATFLGGSRIESSINVMFNSQDQLYVLLGTDSPNFPTTANSLDPAGSNQSHPAVCLLSNDGTTLLSSTNIKGNRTSATEFCLDNNENVIVFGRTNNLPYALPAGSYNVTPQNTGSELYLLKLDPLLSTIVAGTYYGGTGTEFATDIIYNKALDEILIAGSLSVLGGNLPATNNVFSNTGNDFLTRFDNQLTQLRACAKMNDNISKIGCDGYGYIYVVGKGDPVPSPNVYFHTSGEGFISKICGDLSQLILETQIGGSNILFPMNLQVSDAGYCFIYSQFDYSPLGPGTTDADLDPNAFATMGSFYFQVLSPNFAGSVFSTFIGSTNGDHFHSTAKKRSGTSTRQYWSACTNGPNWWFTNGAAYQYTTGGFDMAGIVFDVEIDTTFQPVPGVAFVPFNDTVICIGDTLKRVAQLPATAKNFSWTLDGHTVVSDTVLTQVFDTTGTHNIVYTFTDSGACHNRVFTDSFTVFVGYDNFINLSFAPNDTACLGDTISFSGQSGSNATLLWDFGDGTQASDSNVSHLFMAGGSYTVILTATDSQSCKPVLKDTVTIYIHAADEVTIMAQPADSVCLGQPITLSAAASSDVDYHWDLGDGTTGSNADVSHLYNDPGSYRVILTATDSGYCGVIQVRDTLDVYVKPAVPIDIYPKDTVVCNATGPLTVTVSGGALYQWIPADAVSDPTSGETKVTKMGRQELQVTVTDSLNCTSTHSFFVEQYNSYADAGPDQYIPRGEQAILDGSRSRGTNIYWDAHPTLSDPSSKRPVSSPPSSQWYYINAVDGSCHVRDSALVSVIGVNIPNAFTPNNDGRNDIFHILVNEPKGVHITFQVYNRFGERVFFTQDTKAGWDGTYKGVPCDLGVYYYDMRYSIGSFTYYLKGDIMLMR